MVIYMNLFSMRIKRCLALMMTLALLASAGDFGLITHASAVTYVTKKMYTLLAEEYFSETGEANVVAAGILSSGALTGDGSAVRVAYPDSSALSLSDGELKAKKVSSQYQSLRWTPYSCTINGNITLFNGATSLEVGDPQGARLDVEYRLVLTNLNSTLLQAPATLLSEAKGQKSVLDRLSSSNEPYMGYMEKLTYGKMDLMYTILDPDPDNIFADKVVLDPATPQKNTALKNCFREVIKKMQGSCYTSTNSEQMLTIYTLLDQYTKSGLSHYYKNYNAYKTEINAFKGYLDELLKAETRDGVYLSEEDKKNGVANMIECAKKYESLTGVSIPDFAVDFVALQQKMDEVDKRLTAPNAMINISSANLSKLTALLENGKVANSYSEQPTLRTVLSIQSCKHEYDDDSDATCNLCGMEREVSSDADASGSDGSGDDSASSNDPESDNSDANDSNPGNSGTDSDGSGDDSANSNDPESDNSDASGSNPGNSGTDSDGSGDDSAGSNDPESDNSDASGSNPGNSGTDSDDDVKPATSVTTATQFQNVVSSATDGDVITLSASVAMQSDISVNKSISVVNADKLSSNGYALSLTSTQTSITADSALDVVSAVDGYIPVKAESSYTYTLAEVSAPKTGGEVAGSKSESLNESRYLFLDLDPSKGMTLDAFRASAVFEQLSDYTVTLSIAGNNGTDLIKTTDRLVVTAKNSAGKQVAQITYIIIVMGDTNCNGKVNTSDAAITKNISMGKEYSTEVMLASDINFSGTLESPKVNSSDVSYMMAKWFAWDMNKYVSNMK